MNQEEKEKVMKAVKTTTAKQFKQFNDMVKGMGNNASNILRDNLRIEIPKKLSALNLQPKFERSIAPYRRPSEDKTAENTGRSAAFAEETNANTAQLVENDAKRDRIANRRYYIATGLTVIGFILLIVLWMLNRPDVVDTLLKLWEQVW